MTTLSLLDHPGIPLGHHGKPGTPWEAWDTMGSLAEVRGKPGGHQREAWRCCHGGVAGRCTQGGGAGGGCTQGRWYRARVLSWCALPCPGYSCCTRTPRTDWCTAAAPRVTGRIPPVKDLPEGQRVSLPGWITLPSLVSLLRHLLRAREEGRRTGRTGVWIATGPGRL